MKKSRVHTKPEPHVEKAPDPAVISEEVNKAIETRLSVYKERLRYFLYGLGFFVALVIGLELVSKTDIIRTLHKMAFPPELPPPTPVSYSTTITLKTSDPQLQLGSMTFYAKPDQKVEAFIDAAYRFRRTDDPPQPVKVSVDEMMELKDLSFFKGQFMDITGYLQKKGMPGESPDSLATEKLLHKIGLSLDPAYPNKDSPQVIDITCIVHVTDTKK